MGNINNLISCWRYGVVSYYTKVIQRLLRTFIVIVASYFLFVEKGFVDKLISGSSVLIDVLFGLPLILALLVVLDIVILGLVKSLACLMGWVSIPDTYREEI
jgi:hypothetical protein